MFFLLNCCVWNCDNLSLLRNLAIFLMQIVKQELPFGDTERLLKHLITLQKHRFSFRLLCRLFNFWCDVKLGHLVQHHCCTGHSLTVSYRSSGAQRLVHKRLVKYLRVQIRKHITTIVTSLFRDHHVQPVDAQEFSHVRRQGFGAPQQTVAAACLANVFFQLRHCEADVSCEVEHRNVNYSIHIF